DGRCVVSLACAAHSDCAPDQRCEGGRCEDVLDCSDATSCVEPDTTCVGGACVFTGECAGPDDCAMGFACVDGRCALTGECVRDADCATGARCDAGRCVATGCRDDSDCPGDELCSSIVRRCVP